MNNTPARNLLTNGLPFEYVVARTLSEEGLYPKGPYTFHVNFTDKLIESSIDNVATLEEGNIAYRMLIECKYANLEKKWVFFREINHPLTIPTSLAGIVPGETHLLDISKSFRINPRKNVQIKIKKHDVDFAIMGLEVDNAKSDNKIITKACSQLQWATIDMYLKYQLFLYEQPESMRDNNAFTVFIPIILTNAPLYYLRNDVTLADLSSSPLSAITTKADFVAFYHPLNYENKKAAFSLLGEYFPEKFYKTIKSEYSISEKDLKSQHGYVCSELPAMFWITNPEKLSLLMSFIKEKANDYSS